MNEEARTYRLTFAVLCCGVGVFSLLQSMVTPVLPTIEHALHTDQTTVTWLVTAYLVSASVCTPIVGRVGDRVGKERMLAVALAALALGSLLGALAPSIGLLIAARAIQGIGGGVVPLTFGIIRDELPPEKTASAVGIAAALVAVGGGFGLVLAGPLVDTLGYRSLFWLPGVLTIVVTAATVLIIPASPERAPGPVNLANALLLSSWLVMLLLAISQGHGWGWGSAPTLGLLLGAVLLFPTWLVAESRSTNPLIDMTLMRLPTIRAANLVALLFGIGMYAMFAFLPQFMQTPRDVTGYGFSATVTESGLLMLPQSVATFLAGLGSGALTARFGSKAVLVAGAVLTAIGTLGMVVARDQVWQVVLSTTIRGFAFGLAFAAISHLVVEAAPRTQTGVASGVNANIRTIGGALGSALVATLVTYHARPDGLPIEASYSHAFVFLTATSVVAAALALFVPARERSDDR